MLCSFVYGFIIRKMYGKLFFSFKFCFKLNKEGYKYKYDFKWFDLVCE